MAKARILFIDDDSFLRKVYQAELSEKGFEVLLAVDGEDGLQKTAELHPDLIILDIIMPRKNGFEVLTELRKYKETKRIPVIVLSNLAQSDDQQRAIDLGANEYLVKDNTTLDIIAQKINQHISKAQSAPAEANGAPSITEAFKRTSDTKPTEKDQKEITTPTAPKKDRGHNFCPNCGFKLLPDAKFCPDCGQHIA